MRRYITLRADDFGQDCAIDEGILELAERGRVTAVACLASARGWPAAVKQLTGQRQRLSVGLNVNLTEGVADATPLPQLLLQLLARRLDKKAISARLERQLDRFEDHWQAPPAFVSSHQQVHVLPQVRTLLFTVLARRYSDRPLLCDPTRLVTATDTPLKCALLRRLGVGFREQAQQYRFPLNASFGGLYSLSPKADFTCLFNTWVHQQSHTGMIMCQPAKGPSRHLNAGLLAARQQQFNYLSSAAIPDLLECTGVCLQRLQGSSYPPLPATKCGMHAPPFKPDWAEH